MLCLLYILVAIVLITGTTDIAAFQPATFVRSLPTSSFVKQVLRTNFELSSSSLDDNDGVVELGEDSLVTSTSVVAPFLSQGNITEDVLNIDLNDPKQTRVILYIILSLVPVLFLIPLMLGSRDLIPLDALPPVTL